LRYHALACDFDGTLAWNGNVDGATVAALHRLRESGRKSILVTGRELDDLIGHFSDLQLFDRVVAENGAVVYLPTTGDQFVLGDAPPEAFVNDLHQRGVGPISVGDVIVATWHPHEATVLDTIEQHGLEHHVVFNKGAVMVLPAGVNKATGLRFALQQLRLSPRNTICAGDAENDQTMFQDCEIAVAVNNALATVKANADLVTHGHHGAGVVELVDRLVTNDLSDVGGSLHRHDVLLGRQHAGEPVVINPYDTRMLLAGAPRRGKSWLATGLIERLIAHGYQVCVIDPEGDYGTIPDIIHVGDSNQPPSVEELAQLLESPAHSVVANLLALPFADRPQFLTSLCGSVRDLRERTGRPHWFIVDEAHHLLPQHLVMTCAEPIATAPGVLLITVHPEHLASEALQAMNVVLAVDPVPSETLDAFAGRTGRDHPETPQVTLGVGEAVVWDIRGGMPPVQFHAATCRSRHLRHRRKYAEGDMGWERSFYFTGPANRQYARAHNLIAFMAIGDDVDDETWIYHARRGDYSRWIRDAIGDHQLADCIAGIEASPHLPAVELRRLTRQAIEQRYTLPA
jgi:HAD superfamily hydrolase (TIGR01484 family)